VLEILVTVLLGTVKFGMTFPLAIIEFHFGFFETIFWLNLGGAIGIFFFAYLSEYLNKQWNRWMRNRRRKKRKTEPDGRKAIFTRRNRRIIRIKQKYGLAGIAFATPILFSIPIGVFLVIHYYHTTRYKLVWMLGSNIIWSFIYTSFYFFAYSLIR